MLRVCVDNDNASEDWKGAIVAIECRDHPQDETADTTAALAYECEDLTPKGGAKAVSQEGASGGEVVECDDLSAGWLTVLGSEIAGVGHMTHKGARRMKFRVYDPGGGSGGVVLRLDWRPLGTLGWTHNASVPVPVVDDFMIVDLGETRPQAAVIGDERWEWRVSARAPGGSGTIRLDRVWVLPTEQILTVRALAADGETQGADLQSQKSAGTVADDSGVGTIAWSDPSNAKASDGSYATAEITDAATTHYLKATNFGFALPEGATVLGIIAGIQRKQQGGSVRDARVHIIKGGSIEEVEDKAWPSIWPTADEYQFYGDASDLWGQTWTNSDINNSGFGIALAASKQTGFKKASVNHMQITVYYTEAVNENRVCFATRSMEFRSDGVYRQHPEDDIWGKLVPEDGFYLEMPAGGLGGRAMRGIIIPSQGSLGATADSGTNKLSVQVFARRGYLFAREAAA